MSLQRKGIRLAEQQVSEQQIYSHLLACDGQFQPRLSLRVDLADYSRKIFEKARTFAALRGPLLVGLVALYLDETTPPKGFVTNVSVLAEFSGERLATTLLSACLCHARKKGAQSVSLEVLVDNSVAIGLYEKFGFEKVEMIGAFLSMKLDLSAIRRRRGALQA